MITRRQTLQLLGTAADRLSRHEPAAFAQNVAASDLAVLDLLATRP